MEDVKKCSYCREEVPVDETRRDNWGQIVCNICYEDYFVSCQNCGIELHIDDTVYSDNTGNNYCSRDCMYDAESINIDFSRDKDCSHINKGKRVYGIELEFETTNDNSYDIAEDIFYKYENEVESIGKDGSLSDDGIEIRTQPLPKNKILEFIDDLYTNYSRFLYTTDATGIHINVNIESFKSRLNLYKMMLLIYSNKREIMYLCNRENDEYCEINLAVLKFVKESLISNNPRTAKYSAMNFHTNRIEFRLFGNVMDKNRIKFYVEFIDALEQFVKDKSIQEVQEEETFYNFLVYLERISDKYGDDKLYNDLYRLREKTVSFY